MKTILVPLDGSPHSDEVLDDVSQLLIELDGVEVTLLRVVDPHPWPSEEEERDEEGGHVGLRREAAERHLQRVSESLRSAGAAEVTAKVVMGDPSLEILRKIAGLAPDLVAMATHGRSGPSRWFRGSVAERVLRASSAPLLLVNPSQSEGRTQGTRFRRILVPLDGSELAAGILPLAETFARTYRAEMLLVRVVPPPVAAAAEVPYPMVVPSLQTPEEASEALTPLRDRLIGAGLKARVITRQGSPASELLDLVEAEDVDLVAMTTHGARGFDRWLFGSVAEKLARNCPVPLLVLRVAGSESPEVPWPAKLSEG